MTSYKKSCANNANAKKEKYVAYVANRFDDIRMWRRNGLSFRQISSLLGIHVATLCRYQNKHPELKKLLQETDIELSNKIADAAQDTLFTKLNDRYEISEETTIQKLNKDGEVIGQQRIIKKKLIPADVTACIFALKARKASVWNQYELEISKAKLEKLKTETANLNKHGDLASLISEKLGKYMSNG